MKVNEEFLDVIGHMISHINLQEKRIAETERVLAAVINRITEIGESTVALANAVGATSKDLDLFSDITAVEITRINVVSSSHYNQIMECKDRLDYISSKPYNKS